MKRLNGRIFLMVLIIAALVFSSITAAFAEEGAAGLDNFSKQKTYNNQFTDVKSSDWFNENVKAVYRYGLMVGMSETKFSPKSNVTIAQAFTIAARLNQIYETGSENFSEGSPWYQVYLDYAAQKGFLSESRVSVAGTANNPATRAEFAAILANCLPKDVLDEINPVVSGSIPDVASNRMYSQDIYRLYRAGIIVGNDKKGTFAPDKNITRAEVAAIVTRMVDRSLRMKLDPNSPLITGVKSGRMEMEIDWLYGFPYLAIYDENGRFIEGLDKSGDVEKMEYDSYGNLKSITDYEVYMGEGFDSHYTVLPAKDGTLFAIAKDGMGISKQYNQNKEPIKLITVNNYSNEQINYNVDTTITYVKDERGRITQVVLRESDGFVSRRIMATYNGNGKIIETQDIWYDSPYEYVKKFIYKYYYNSKGQLRMVSQDTDWGMGNIAYSGAVKYEYNEDGFLQYTERTDSGNVTYRGVYYVYGDLQRPYLVTSLNCWELDSEDVDLDGNTYEIFRYTYPIN